MTPAHHELVRRLVVEPVAAGLAIAALVAGIVLGGPCGARVTDADVAAARAAVARIR